MHQKKGELNKYIAQFIILAEHQDSPTRKHLQNITWKEFNLTSSRTYSELDPFPRPWKNGILKHPESNSSNKNSRKLRTEGKES